MQPLAFVRAALAAVVLVVCPALAGAQIYEAVGIRAQGMGGAFVAVADDATSSWWNPAGMATGPLFSMVVERGQMTLPGDFPQGGPARRERVNNFAFAVPSLALSYYRLRVDEIAPVTSAEDPPPGLETGGMATLRRRAVSYYGATVGQSTGEHFVMASTIKIVRAGMVSAIGPSAGSLDLAGELDVPVQTKLSLDVGAMASFGPVRLGLSVRQLREPTFGDGDDRFVLERQARAGAAVVMGPTGPLGGATASFDADLTTTSTVVGDVRHVAAGGELWLGSDRWVGLRGGLSWNTVGPGGSSASAGLSVGMGSGMHLQGAATVGSDRSRKGWAAGLGVTF